VASSVTVAGSVRVRVVDVATFFLERLGRRAANRLDLRRRQHPHQLLVTSTLAV
jgi:hypothetical protein